jgi:hypothetical protein
MERESQDETWTTIDRFFHPTDAHIAAGRIESEGIPVFLLGINHASANWLLSNALGGIRVQVPANHVEEARAILAEIAQPLPKQDKSCPKCGSMETSAMSNSRKVAFLAVHLFSLPLPWQDTRRHCQACGSEWVVTDNS